MALTHIATATPNWDMNEFAPEAGTFKEEIVSNIVEIRDGYFIPPEAPGLGIDINVEEMAKHPYEAGPGERSRRPDGSLTLG
jgi:galactonate dehydratase